MPATERDSILVVRPGALGDTILGLPVLRSIRDRRPDSRIVMLGTRAYRSLVPGDVEFHGIDDPELLGLFERSTDESRYAFDEAYVILNDPVDLVRNLRRCGTERVHHAKSAPDAGTHVVECLHERLGLEVPLKRPVLLSTSPVREKAILWLHPGSGGPRKCVPPDLQALCAARAAKALGLRVAVTLGEADGFLRDLPGWDEPLSEVRVEILENRPLEEIRQELRGASLFLGNDSGISHLAAGLGIPSIVLFVSTDPAQWAPWAPEEQVAAIDLRGLDLMNPREREALINAVDEARLRVQAFPGRNSSAVK